MSDRDIVQEAKDAFKKAEEAESDNRDRFLDDLRFGRLGEQWPESVRNERDQEGRPCLTVNRIPSFVRQVVNDARLNKPSIRVHPVDDDADPETAEVLNGLIRNIEVMSNADAAYDTAIESAVSGGFGYFRVDVDYASNDEFDLDILIKRVANPLTVYGDPKSTAVDSSDWNTAFVTELMDKEDFEAQYKGAEPSSWESDYADAKDSEWIDDDSVRVAEYWTREPVDRELVKLTDGQVMFADVFQEHYEHFSMLGIDVAGSRTVKSNKVMQRIVTGAEVLEETEWAGQYIPIIPVYGDEVVVEGKRHFYSLFHFAKDSQQMFNFWRTATTELVALAPKAPYIGPVDAFETESEKWATANTKSHPYLGYDGNMPPQRQPFAGPPAGALQEALNASDDMKAIMGLFDASLGNRSNETSGVAINARKKEGDIATFHFSDNMTRAIRHAGKVIVDLIPHVYGQDRVVRILGEDETPSTVKIGQGQAPRPQMSGMPGQQAAPEDEQEALPRIYDLTVGKYDVTVKSGPSFTTRREESAAQMMELLRAFPQAAPIIGDLLAKNLDWPGADDIAERLKKMLPPQVQGDPEKDQMRAKIEELGRAFEAIKQDKSIDQAKIANDARKIGIDQYKAETDRMEALARIEKDAREAVRPVPVTSPYGGGPV